MVLSENSTVTITAGSMTTVVMDTAGAFAYFTHYLDKSGKITQLNLATSTTNVLTTSTARPDCGVIDRNDAFMYIGFDTTPGKIEKINLTTFTSAGTIVPSIARVRGAVIDNQSSFAYFSSFSTGAVSKINLATFTESGTCGIATTINKAIAIDSTSSNLYLASWSGNNFTRIQLSTFTVTGTATTLYTAWNMSIDRDNGTCFYGDNASVARIQAMNLPTLTSAGTIVTTQTTPSLSHGFAIDNSAFYVNRYATTSTAFCILEQINYNGGTAISASSITLSIHNNSKGAIEPSGTYLYLGGWKQSAICKVQISGAVPVVTAMATGYMTTNTKFWG